MKSVAVRIAAATLLVLVVVQAPLPAGAVQLQRRHAINAENPVPQVVSLLSQLKQRIEADGKLEQASYDKYACWCEDTMARKAKDIADSKQQIQELGEEIVKLKAEIAGHAAEIDRAKKDMAANVDSRREATEVRDKESAGYNEEKIESEQCTGALEAAIKVLTGAGAKKGFLETLQEAQLLSVVGGVRSLLAKPKASKVVSSSDLDVIKRFVERPQDFVGPRGASGVSAAQVGNNPFGDYAPQSTQIQGILKGMYDTFVGDLEKSNAGEADAQKAFEALMVTKLAEYKTLEATLQQHELDEAAKSMKLAESQELLDDTKAQLAADEEFFATTKANCQTKAAEWSERTRLRTEELSGIARCVGFLNSPENQAIFERAHTTLFLQLSSRRAGGSSSSSPRRDGQERTAAYSALKGLASKYKNMHLAQIALQLKSGGHFDKVMAAIDSMIALLRREEQDDISHRDRCQNAENKNSNDMEDLSADISKAGVKLQSLQQQIDALRQELLALQADIEKTESDREERLTLRNEEEDAFKKALQDDADAVALIQSAIEAMQAFYRRNKLPMSLVHVAAANYTVDQDKAPETTWSGPGYGGRKSESEGLIAILEMIKEDLQKEMQTARHDDVEAQALYKKEDGVMAVTLDKQRALKLATEKELGEIQGDHVDTEEYQAAKERDHTAETHLQSAIYRDCSWVATHFDSRREKRKAELAGLEEAKSYLAGVESGTALAP